jgi:hypothetical protein
MLFKKDYIVILKEATTSLSLENISDIKNAILENDEDLVVAIEQLLKNSDKKEISNLISFLNGGLPKNFSGALQIMISVFNCRLFEELREFGLKPDGRITILRK